MKKRSKKNKNKPTLTKSEVKLFRDAENHLLPFEENWHCRPDSAPKTKESETSIRDQIADQYPDIDLLFMDEKEFDEAIIGVCEGISVSHNPKVAYDYDKVIEANMKMGMTYEEAVEYFDFNQAGAWMGEHTPVFITRIKP